MYYIQFTSPSIQLISNSFVSDHRLLVNLTLNLQISFRIQMMYLAVNCFVQGYPGRYEVHSRPKYALHASSNALS